MKPNVFDYAIQMEKDGEQFYRELAAKCREKGIANILTMLADAEARHAVVFDQMKMRAAPKLVRGAILSDVKNVFVRMRDAGIPLVFEATELELYRKAQKIEDETRRVYLHNAQQVADPAQKEMFQRIAAEEQKHYTILQNIIELVSKPEPGNWLENAEWHHLDEY